WRPQRFEDVIGQRGVVDTLRNAIASGRLAQSFIFAGPRGVGKTTTARILARALNCVNGPTPDPCGECDACREIAEGRDVDVMEIDGATYTGIDAVREVIVEPLSIAPMRDRYKVFIIDEVHRLSKNAFDALLKSVEEPPPYVKFMMATTELNAVPDTIQSRSQVFELKALPFASIRDQLRGVTMREEVQVEEAALALVARAAEGSMRDALSALDQVLAFTSTNVTAADVSTVLGVIGRDVQFDVAEMVAREDASAVFAQAGAIVESGFDLRTVCRELARLMRDLMVIRIDVSRLADPEIASEGERERMQALAEHYSREDLMRSFDLLSSAERDIRTSSQPRHTFEMALLKWIHLRKLTPIEDLLAGTAGPPPRAAAAPSRRATSAPSTSAPSTSAPSTSAPSTSAPPRQAPSRPPAAPVDRPRSGSGSAAAVAAPASVKQSLLASIRESNKIFFAMVIAQVQTVEVAADQVVFTFAPAHKNLRGQLEAKRAWIEGLAKNLTGRTMTVVVKEAAAAGESRSPGAAQTSADSTGRQADLRARAKAEPAVQNVLDVFGGDIEDVEEIQ
ncbi:MAG: DNA polymerase III subunit gamma/tau, partial [Acidobacteria bacterium]|nr:DNA polymerase III subunit gamma/tau [Acidobacteriota bacterium]